MNEERGAEHWLGELLAVIHCDGGHYQADHGTEKATRDAITKRGELVQEIDRLHGQLAAERQRNFDAEKELRDKARARIEELQQQLAAEREKA
jgi:hypothetical protein